MKHLLLVLVMALCFLPVRADAEEVRFKRFSVDLPSGWEIPIPYTGAGAINKDKVDSVVTFTGHRVFVSITTSPVRKSAEDAAAALCENLHALDASYPDLKTEVRGPVKKGRSSVVEFTQGPDKGIYWFTSNGNGYSIVSLFAGKNVSLEPGKALLRKIKPFEASLFPTDY